MANGVDAVTNVSRRLRSHSPTEELGFAAYADRREEIEKQLHAYVRHGVLGYRDGRAQRAHALHGPERNDTTRRTRLRCR